MIGLSLLSVPFQFGSTAFAAHLCQPRVTSFFYFWARSVFGTLVRYQLDRLSRLISSPAGKRDRPPRGGGLNAWARTACVRNVTALPGLTCFCNYLLLLPSLPSPHRTPGAMAWLIMT
ncbi:hypothetical protein GGR50DRAFT_639365 [Xylaria sp. CBS 124048]|nr:hypothetical protein GGR50DRAFT_639365 [Xylaria sp. CBS 124048]